MTDDVNDLRNIKRDKYGNKHWLLIRFTQIMKFLALSSMAAPEFAIIVIFIIQNFNMFKVNALSLLFHSKHFFIDRTGMKKFCERRFPRKMKLIFTVYFDMASLVSLSIARATLGLKVTKYNKFLRSHIFFIYQNHLTFFTGVMSDSSLPGVTVANRRRHMPNIITVTS